MFPPCCLSQKVRSDLSTSTQQLKQQKPPTRWLNQPIWKICASQIGSWNYETPRFGVKSKKSLKPWIRRFSATSGENQQRPLPGNMLNASEASGNIAKKNPPWMWMYWWLFPTNFQVSIYHSLSLRSHDAVYPPTYWLTKCSNNIWTIKGLNMFLHSLINRELSVHSCVDPSTSFEPNLPKSCWSVLRYVSTLLLLEKTLLQSRFLGNFTARLLRLPRNVWNPKNQCQSLNSTTLNMDQ